jgi:outer membrane lipoprotein LolB
VKCGRAGGFAIAALLAACAHTTSVPDWRTSARSDTHYFESSRLVIEELAAWKFGGRIAARNGKDGGQATIRWSLADDTHRLELFGPFGGGGVKMEYGPQGATLWDGKGNRYVRESEQALLDEVVGWRIPFSDLGYWLFGLASRAEPALFQIDENGNLSRLEQSGWEIEFSDYRDLGGRLLPGKISAVHLREGLEAKGTSNDVTVRIISRSWSQE